MTVANPIKEISFEDLPIYDATQLTKGGDLARIKLGDQLYTLRITRSGKLILTKWIWALWTREASLNGFKKDAGTPSEMRDGCFAFLYSAVTLPR